MRDGAAIVFAHELRVNLRGLLAWLLPVGALLALTCALQRSYVDSGLFEAKLQSLPAAMRHALGLELVDFRRPPVYLATNFLFVVLPSSLFAGLLGAALVAKEEILHTAELLYAQPASRGAILAGKAGALALHVIAFPATLGAIAIATLGAMAAAPLEAGLVAQLFAGAVTLAIAFAGLGMLIAALVRDARAAAPVALGLVFGTYLIGVISAIAAPAAPLRFLSPFKLVEPSTTVAAGGLAPVRAAALIALGVAAGALAIARYRRRDLHA
jgi:beta-exotoxin I transport system permease protein